MSANSVLELLRNVRELVGEKVFNESVTALGATPSTTPGAPPKKERKQNKVDPEKSAKRSEEMGSLQNFIKTVRAEQPAETPYKDIQKLAGERWKTMDTLARAQYKPKTPELVVPADSAPAPVPAPAKVVKKAVKSTKEA